MIEQHLFKMKICSHAIINKSEHPEVAVAFSIVKIRPLLRVSKRTFRYSVLDFLYNKRCCTTTEHHTLRTVHDDDRRTVLK